MYYSAISGLSIIICILTNYDVFGNGVENASSASHKSYRRFLVLVMLYFASDALWGVLYEYAPVNAVFIDTTVYFVAMALAVVAWTNYVIAYLEEKTMFRNALAAAGWLFLIFELAVVVINIFTPLLFYFDADGIYHAGGARHITLGFQVLMFAITAAYTLSVSSGTENRASRLRYRAVGLFGAVMIIMITIQILYPLLPFYAVGYLIGTCLIHTFVHEDEKAEHRKKLEEMLRIEQEQRLELIETKNMAYTDSLTGVKNSHAYVEMEEAIDQRISKGIENEFGVIVLDLNGLKQINDTRGHEAGDAYIIEASRIICNLYVHSPVYRIGGDEFAVLLEGSDYKEREYLLQSLNRTVEDNIKNGRVVIAAGMDIFRPGIDNSYHRVFERADMKMYERKSELKKMSEGETRWKDMNILRVKA